MQGNYNIDNINFLLFKATTIISRELFKHWNVFLCKECNMVESWVLVAYFDGHINGVGIFTFKKWATLRLDTTQVLSTIKLQIVEITKHKWQILVVQKTIDISLKILSMHNAPSLMTTFSDFQSSSSANVNASDFPNSCKALRYISLAFVMISPTYSKKKVPLQIFCCACNSKLFSPKNLYGNAYPSFNHFVATRTTSGAKLLYSWRKNLLVWQWHAKPGSRLHCTM